MKSAEHVQNMLSRIIFFCIMYFLSSPQVYCQGINNVTDLNRKLDSAELLNLKHDYYAVDLCRNILTGARSLNIPKIQARALNELSDIHRSFREYEEAEKTIKEAKEILMNHDLTNDIEYARNLYYMGKLLRSVNSSEINEVKDSILACYTAAWKICEMTENPNNNFKAELLFGMGYFQHTLSNIDGANEYYRKLIQFLNKNFDKADYRRGMYLFYMAMHFMYIGDYERSLILTQTAAYILGINQIFDINNYIQCEKVIGDNYYNSEQYQKAADQYLKVIELIYKQNDFQNPVLLRLYTNISQPFIYLKQYDKAIEYSLLALKFSEDQPGPEDNLYYIHNNLAEAYEQKGDDVTAEMYFKKSINLRLNLFGAEHEEVYNGYMYFGDYFDRKGDYLKALEYYQKSLGALFQDADSEDIYNNPNFENYANIEQLLYLLFRKAGSFFKLYEQSKDIRDIQISYSLYQTIYRLTDRLLNSSYLDKSSMQIFQRFEEDLQMSIDCAVHLYEITSEKLYLEQSFQFIEKNKYFLLRKALSNSENSGNLSSKSQKAFTKEIGRLQRSINITSNADELFDLQNELLEIYNEKDRLYPPSAPKNKMSVSEEKNTISLQNAQGLIVSDSEILVEYYWAKDHIYAFVISQNSVDIIKIEITALLTKSIEQYATALTNSGHQSGDFKIFTSSAFKLYEILIKPIENLAYETLDIGQISRLIIIPDGPLATLPFEAFISEPDSVSESYWGLDYLCKKYIMSYAYSLNILKNNLDYDHEKRAASMLAMSYSELSDDFEKSDGQTELPYSAEEIISIRKHLKSQTYLGKAATEKVFKEIADKFSIIHLAMHGQADTSDMFNSRLIFKNESDSEEDGELHAYELYDMDFSNLDLAVLSACETGIGQKSEGEGIFSIARGFAFAGCPSIVMSLWKVNDKTTANLMDYFYANLAENIPKDEALRNAKLSFIKNADDLNSHPSNWAAFIALGNNQAIPIPRPNNFLTYILFSISLLIILLIYVGRNTILKFPNKILRLWEPN